ncbi:EamA-like transporter family protein [Meinhardsimonia xiamenensis]|jgi:drug/metabolite transporter (DMT)-like permease|uniref:EamA-like transporter family protein n=1 Tax=Meinhardsimonia xiamenensis TaxID=990712 RepID=A0A1G9CCW7_9RHOB|nr:DMT family transporter [Meinhardsimonia xiamenensis]PRX38406.1 EamA-like transporter family protein [Meinhardsimonia xiamenensis]SDK49477.1 EamA-like transporter family protein [Meinhardsimonia xiamenensis]
MRAGRQVAAAQPIHVAALLVIGAGWGLTQPLAKIAVTAGLHPLGMVFWQQVIVALILGAVLALRGRLPGLSAGRMGWFAVIALLGTILPNSAGYTAAIHLPAGIISIVTSMVPIFAWPVAIALGADRFERVRAAGLALGLAGVAVLVLPGAGLPRAAAGAFVLLAALAPLCYAFEGNLIARFGTAGLDPVQLLFGASIVGAAGMLPLTLATGTWFELAPHWTAGDAALVVSSVIHAVVYAGYFAVVRRAGAVFAAQVAYLVTGFGVLWAMLLLGERYPASAWLAMALILTGMTLVRPRLT